MVEENLIHSPDTYRSNRIPPGHKLTKKFPVLSHGSAPKVDISQWNFYVTGLVEKERELSFAEFSNLKRVNILSDIHRVTTWTKLDNHFEGPSTSKVN
jgi:DMSO/TMAO reductase YedYZ molybdopterin-dependent catalytic subunit